MYRHIPALGRSGICSPVVLGGKTPMDKIRIQWPFEIRSLTDPINFSESEFRGFLTLIIAHKVVRELAPELVDRAVAELSSLRAFQHNLN
jgi:hypothetical protein